MEFTVTIKLGNEAVQTGPDIATLLEVVITQLNDIDEPYPTSRRIMDANSSTRVGEWGFRES